MLWALLQLSGLAPPLVSLLGFCLGSLLVFYRTMTPRAALTPGLVLGLAVGVGALLFMLLVTAVAVILGMTAIELGGEDVSNPVALLTFMLMFAGLVLTLALQFIAPALSYHDRRLRGLKAWRISLRHFRTFLGLAVTLVLCLILLGVLALIAVALFMNLANPPIPARPRILAFLVGPSVGYATAMTAAAMAEMTRQALAVMPNGLADVFD